MACYLSWHLGSGWIISMCWPTLSLWSELLGVLEGARALHLDTREKTCTCPRWGSCIWRTLASSVRFLLGRKSDACGVFPLCPCWSPDDSISPFLPLHPPCFETLCQGRLSARRGWMQSHLVPPVLARDIVLPQPTSSWAHIAASPSLTFHLVEEKLNSRLSWCRNAESACPLSQVSFACLNSVKYDLHRKKNMRLMLRILFPTGKTNVLLYDILQLSHIAYNFQVLAGE